MKKTVYLIGLVVVLIYSISTLLKYLESTNVIKENKSINTITERTIDNKRWQNK